MAKELLKIFRNLEGDWSLNRKIYDAISGNVEYATGEATFRSESNLNMNGAILAYEEVGVLNLSATKKHLKFRRSYICLLYTSPSPRDKRQSRMPSSA